MATSAPVHFMGFWPDYEVAFFTASAQARRDVAVFNPAQLSQHFYGFARFPRFIRNAIQRAAITRYVQQHPDGFFVVHEHRLILEALARLPRLPRLAILMRNPVDPKGKALPIIQRLAAAGCQVWSFDPHDVGRYGWHFYRQFIAALPAVAEVAPVYDFAFIGRNKGREALLQALQARLTQLGFRVLFDVRSDSMKGVRANVPYVDYLRQCLAAKCIVDITQRGQSGLTLRPLEAMAYQRKLLTNNPLVATEAFYHPDNVFVMDDALELNGIHAFMDRPVAVVGAEVQELYSVQGLLQLLRAG